jgi:Reverse transcriptase (RNA-dependent DNA polymerase)
MSYSAYFFNWLYSKLLAVVRWNVNLSQPFVVGSGIRQGSLLSPCIFNVFVNLFITKIREANIGCCVHDSYCGRVAGVVTAR